MIADHRIGRRLTRHQIWVDDEFVGLDAIGDNCVQTAANAHQASGGDVMRQEGFVAALTAVGAGGSKIRRREYWIAGEKPSAIVL